MDTLSREDLAKLAQATEDDDAQAPEEVVKALLKVAAGKGPAVKQISEWLVSRLMETNSPRVKLKVLRLMMLIMSSKKGAKFKAQLKLDGEEVLQATTSFQTEADPDHGDKPMMWVRKSAVKCLELLELPVPAPGPSVALEQTFPQEAPTSPAAAARVAAPPPALTAAAQSVIRASPPRPTATQLPASSAGVEATVDALVQHRVTVALSAVEDRILAAARDAQQAKESVAAAEVRWSTRMEAVERRMDSFASELAPKLASVAELEERLRTTIDEAAKAIADGGDTGLAAMAALRLEEMAMRVEEAHGAATTARVSNATSLRASHEKLEALASLLLQLRDRANLSERQTAKFVTDVVQLGERVDSVSMDLGAKISEQGASTEEVQIQAEELQVQLEMIDAKFTDANQSQAQWLQEELGNVNADVAAAMQGVDTLESRLGQVSESALDAQTKAVGQVQGTVARLEGKLGAAENRIMMLEAGGDFATRCDGLEGELESMSSIVLAMKSGLDTAKAKLAAHDDQIEEFEQLSLVMEESVAATASEVDGLKGEFVAFTARVTETTDNVGSLVARVLATPEENYDAVLAEANLASVVEFNRAAGRRVLKLTKSVERLAEKVEASIKGQESAWQAINELMGRMQTVRDTVVRLTR